MLILKIVQTVTVIITQTSHITSQSRLFQPEAKPICTSPLQGIRPTTQLASTVQHKC